MVNRGEASVFTILGKYLARGGGSDEEERDSVKIVIVHYDHNHHHQYYPYFPDGNT